MYNNRKFVIIFQCLLIIVLVWTPDAKADERLNDQNSNEKENIELKEQIDNLKHRLKRLEPAEPINIQDPPWGNLPFPRKVIPIRDIIKRGPNIPFDLIVDNPEYQRPAYDEIWHSTVGRWSYVPNRIHYALHRLFTNYDIGLSGWYDFEHNLGINIPMFQNEEALDMYIVAFQTDVTHVFTKGNQVVVVGKPKRHGVQVITITTKDLSPLNKDENILVHLTTQDGYEIDYSLISYVQPDFWAKQKEKLKERKQKGR